MSGGNTEQDFLKYLLQAQRGDPSAQTKIEEFQKKNPRGYLQLLAKILADDTQPEEVRATAGLAWKNLFDIKESSKLREQRAKQWLSLPPDFRKGLKIEFEGQPYVITDFQHISPGKGAAFTRTKMKNLLTNNTIERNIRSGEKVGIPNMEEKQKKKCVVCVCVCVCACVC